MGRGWGGVVIGSSGGHRRLGRALAPGMRRGLVINSSYWRREGALCRLLKSEQGGLLNIPNTGEGRGILL